MFQIDNAKQIKVYYDLKVDMKIHYTKNVLLFNEHFRAPLGSLD